MDKKREVNSQKIRIKLVDGTKIYGSVNVNKDSGYDRLSDLVTTTDESILIVTKAQIYEGGQDSPILLPTLFLNKQHILWSTPVED